MGNKNAWLEQKAAEKNAVMHSTELLIKQYMVDTLCIAIHESDGWGYDRIMRLLDAWKVTRDEYRLALCPRDSEADVPRSTWTVCWSRSSTASRTSSPSQSGILN